MILAWRDCLMWAVGYSPVMQQFAADTGRPLKLASGGFNAMIDKATGNDGFESIEAFTRWVNKNLWGEVDGRGCNGDEPGFESMETR